MSDRIYKKFSDRKFHDGWVASAKHYGYDEIADRLEKQYAAIRAIQRPMAVTGSIDQYMAIVDELLDEVARKLGDK